MYRRIATLAAGLALAAATAALLAPTSAEAACPTEYCTDAGGTYTLTVPPLSGPIFGAYADCVWQVHVDFGDGANADYVFEGDVGLSGSHTFPSYGTYTVTITVSGGYHKNSPTHEACPGLTKYATVTYQDPSKKEEPPPTEQPTEQPNETPTGNGQRPGGGSGGSSKAGEERESGPNHPILVWRRCGSDVYAHRVACAKARRVVKGALEKLSGRGSARVAGFRCRLNPDQPRPISCRRGTSRILGPLA